MRLAVSQTLQTRSSTPFSYELDMSGDTTTVKCRGRIVSETAPELKQLVKPMIPKCRRIVLDLSDVDHIDSSGLGTLVGLKVSAAAAAYCSLQFVNLTPHVKDLFRLSQILDNGRLVPIRANASQGLVAFNNGGDWSLSTNGTTITPSHTTVNVGAEIDGTEHYALIASGLGPSAAAAGTPSVPERLRALEKLIGNTPLLAIEYKVRGRQRTIYAKSEQMNFTGSIKDRMALHILRNITD